MQKIATQNRLSRKIFSCAALLLGLSAASFAQVKESEPPATMDEFKPAKPKNQTGDRKLESAIAAMEEKNGAMKITLSKGEIVIVVKPETEVVREERDLVASDLKVEDVVCFAALKGARKKISIREKAVVTEIAPLKIRIGDAAEMIFLKTDLWEFYRAVPLKTSDLKIGQTIAVQYRLQRDGEIATKRVAVVVVKPKTVRPRKTNAKTTK